MPEENNSPSVQEQLKKPSAEETKLAEELEKLRSRGKFVKIAAIALSVVLVSLVIFGYTFYRKLMAAKQMLDGFSQSAGPAAMGGGNMPAPFKVTASPESAAGSGLGLFSSSEGQPDGAQAGAAPEGALPQVPKGMDPAKAKQIYDAMGKYADRPIVKEFLAEMATDPEFARARETQKNGNPMAMLAMMKSSPKMRAVITKYTKRPDFLPLMMEFMRDPDIRPLMGGVPGGGEEEDMPPLPAARIPAARGVPARTAPEESSDTDGDGEMTFNSEAVSGAGQPAPAGKKTGGAVPPPH